MNPKTKPIMKIDQEEIAVQLARNPEKGFRMLVAAYSEKVYWHVRRLLVNHHDAEDVTQEIFVKIFHSLSSLREPGALTGWIFKIATNESLRFLQKRRPETLPLEADLAEAHQVAADEYVDYTDLEAVKLQQAIHRLPPRQQAAFNLRYYDELSFEEIARITDSTPSNVKVNYHIAKHKVIDYMKSAD